MKRIKLSDIIKKLNVPNVILRYIVMEFLDLASIKKLAPILTVEKLSFLDDKCKTILVNAPKGLFWNCENGQLDAVKWIYSHNQKIDIHAHCEWAFYLACKNNQMEIIKWILSLGPREICMSRFPRRPPIVSLEMGGPVNKVDPDKNRFTWACRFGHLDIAQQIYSSEKSEYCISIDVFEQIYLNGHIDIAKWLCSLYHVNIHDHDEKFRWFCKNGYFDMAQWLYSLGCIDIYACNEAFHLSCDYGHLEITIWLYSLIGGNIHIDNNYAFRRACSHGYLSMAQWLYSLGGIDIHANNKYAFHWANINRHVNVIEWLQTIKENDYFY